MHYQSSSLWLAHSTATKSLQRLQQLAIQHASPYQTSEQCMRCRPAVHQHALTCAAQISGVTTHLISALGPMGSGSPDMLIAPAILRGCASHMATRLSVLDSACCSVTPTAKRTLTDTCTMQHSRHAAAYNHTDFGNRVICCSVNHHCNMHDVWDCTSKQAPDTLLATDCTRVCES